FAVPAAGLTVTTGAPIAITPTVLAQGYKKFPVNIVFDPGCGGSSPGTPSIVDFQGLVPQAIAVDAAGRIHLLDSITGTVRMVELDQTNAIVRSAIVAGLDSDAAPPSDGSDPRLTRLVRPHDMLFD